MNKNFKKLQTLFSITVLLSLAFVLTSNFIFKTSNDVIAPTPEITTTVTYEGSDEIAAKTTAPKIHTSIVYYTDTTLQFHYIIDSRGSDSVGNPYLRNDWAVHPNSTSAARMSATSKDITSNDQLITVTKLTPNTKYSTLTMSGSFVDSTGSSFVNVRSTIPTFTTYKTGYVLPSDGTNLLWIWIILGTALIITVLGAGWWFLIA